MVVISLPSSFSIKWVEVIRKRAEGFGLDGRVYSGIPKSPFPQINNAEYVARNEMYSAKAVFAAVTRNSNEEIEGDWIIQYLPQLAHREIEFNLGLVGIDAAKLASFHKISLPLDAIAVFPKAEKWVNYLFEELEMIAEDNS